MNVYKYPHVSLQKYTYIALLHIISLVLLIGKFEKTVVEQSGLTIVTVSLEVIIC